MSKASADKMNIEDEIGMIRFIHGYAKEWYDRLRPQHALSVYYDKAAAEAAADNGQLTIDPYFRLEKAWEGFAQLAEIALLGRPSLGATISTLHMPTSGNEIRARLLAARADNLKQLANKPWGASPENMARYYDDFAKGLIAAANNVRLPGMPPLQ